MSRVTWSQESILDALVRWNIKYGGPPTVKEMNAVPELPHSGTVRGHFGTTANAFRAAGIRPRPRGVPGHLIPAERHYNGRFVSDLGVTEHV